ncbi:MAG: FAD-dependent monooxygenase [Spirosomaceae bacterium]|nr:FAD-dependent monooxygenase [Spirosomataceae bacterium]
MRQLLNFTLEPEVALDSTAFRSFLLQQYPNVSANELFYQIQKQSIDARNRQVKIITDVEVAIGEDLPSPVEFEKNYQDVSNAKQAIVVGAGPAGLFAALRLIELGIKPIVIERGKDVRARRRDLAAINKDHVVNPDSNYCFGEGGAGTYSDGKLYTRSKKRGDVRRILEILVAHGSTKQILIDAHPHIGTNKLPQVVANLRESILNAGGEIHFETKVIDFIIQYNELKGVITADNQEFVGEGVILATGHSARDIFELLDKKNIFIEAKPFAMGVRIEHQQSFVDACQYHRADRGILPAASYSLVAQTKYKGVQRGVFSFCMCPGGFIVPASTAEGELVVNGMSPSRRDSKFANSGIVVAINEVDWQKYKHLGALAGLELQKQVEQKAFRLALKSSSVQSSSVQEFKIPNDFETETLKLETQNSTRNSCQLAPSQRLVDFTNRKISPNLLETSYQPGLIAMDMNEVLPDIIAMPLRDGIKEFGKKMKGYLTNEAQMIGIESRTSSPVRIPRDRESYEHLQLKRLFPCGEGAGYAGGIVSAAMDGERCAEALASKYA